MELITKLDDERLGDTAIYNDEYGLKQLLLQRGVLVTSLRAALEREEAYSRSILIDKIKTLEAELAEARGQLCRASQALDKACAAVWDAYYGKGITSGYAQNVEAKIKTALSSSSPCRHEADNKRLREFLESGLCDDAGCLDCKVARNILEGKEDYAKRKHF